jgi:DNA mismatch repair protein MutL
MQELLKQLEGTPRSYHCPHGRPVMVEIESREIEKWFKRVL